MKDDAHIQDTIDTCERKVWDALVAGDQDADAAALADDFWGVYPDGQAGKAEHIGQLNNGPTIQSYTIDGARLRALAPDVMLYSYRAVFRRVGRVQSETMYVTSIWEKRAGSWLNIFSQDTPA